jgi:hypothetical protein
MPLLVKLKEKSFHFVGTVRANRLKGCDLKTEKELKKDRRGSYDCKVHSASNIIAVRWYDNTSVDLLSTYIGTEPMGQVRGWDKKQKEYIEGLEPKSCI